VLCHVGRCSHEARAGSQGVAILYQYSKPLGLGTLTHLAIDCDIWYGL
jgi:hypothetical protein